MELPDHLSPWEKLDFWCEQDRTGHGYCKLFVIENWRGKILKFSIYDKEVADYIEFLYMENKKLLKQLDDILEENMEALDEEN